MSRKAASKLFWSTFIGEFVEIITTIQNSGMPFVIQAFLLDVDAEYYYLGPNPDEVQSLVRKVDVAYMAVLNDVDPTTELLNNMEVPEANDAN